MPIYHDQLNREIVLNERPERIISLVPSQTELLYDLGLEAQVVGITKFCIHPESWFRQKTRVGGTKAVKPDIVASLQPDLIIANKEENEQSQIEALEKIAPVWISDIHDVDEALNMISSIGDITVTKEKAISLADKIKKEFEELHAVNYSKIRSAYFIWKDPYMTVGHDTFIHSMMKLAGFENVFADELRYPVIDIETLKTKQTELLMLSSEPFPFKQKHVDELAEQLPGIKIEIVDGEMFSWYGSRMQYAPAYFKRLREVIG